MPILGTIASSRAEAEWFTSRPVPTALGSWFSLAGNSSLIVAGTDDQYIATSPEGVNWTQRTTPAGISRFWTGTWSSTLNLFVFFTFNSTNCVTSPDGITWTLRVQPHSFYRASIFAGGKFVAIGANQVPMCASTDGITFTAGSMPAAVYWLDVAYNGTVYCAVSNNNSPNAVATSTDGLNWTARTTPYNSFSAIAWNGTVFCALTAAGGNQSMTSPDGITWTTRTLPFSYDWSRIVFWNNSLFVATTGNQRVVITSPDGITWTQQRDLPAAAATSTDMPRAVWTGTYLVIMDKPNGNTYVTTSPI